MMKAQCAVAETAIYGAESGLAEVKNYFTCLKQKIITHSQRGQQVFFHFSSKAVYFFLSSCYFLGDDSRTQKLHAELGGDHSRKWKVEEADQAEVGECNY